MRISKLTSRRPAAGHTAFAAVGIMPVRLFTTKIWENASFRASLLFAMVMKRQRG
jgi:hypothetical protein